MSLATIDQLRVDIEQAVPRAGGPPKVSGPALNAVLCTIADELARAEGAGPRLYEETLHFPGQPLFQDTVFEPSLLRALTASAGVALVEVAVGSADFVPVLAAPATTAALALPLPVGPLTYRLTFADASVSYAALKQVIQIQ